MLRGKIALKKLTLTKHNLKTDLIGITNRLNKETQGRATVNTLTSQEFYKGTFLLSLLNTNFCTRSYSVWPSILLQIGVQALHDMNSTVV